MEVTMNKVFGSQGIFKYPFGQNSIMKTFSAVLEKEGDMYVAKCPEIGTVSQGKTIEKALDNLKEATELYLEEFS